MKNLYICIMWWNKKIKRKTYEINKFEREIYHPLYARVRQSVYVTVISRGNKVLHKYSTVVRWYSDGDCIKYKVSKHKDKVSRPVFPNSERGKMMRYYFDNYLLYGFISPEIKQRYGVSNVVAYKINLHKLNLFTIFAL